MATATRGGTGDTSNGIREQNCTISIGDAHETCSHMAQAMRVSFVLLSTMGLGCVILTAGLSCRDLCVENNEKLVNNGARSAPLAYQHVRGSPGGTVLCFHAGS